MRRRVLVVAVSSFIGLLVGGVVGLAAGAVAGLNATRPQLLVRWMIVPLFVAMVLATLLQGRLVQDLGFGEERPLANQIGLALIATVAVLVIEATIPARAQPAGDAGELSDDEPLVDEVVDAELSDELLEQADIDDVFDGLAEHREPEFPDGQSSRVGDGTT